MGSKMPGKIGGLVNKAFGNNCYEYQVSEYAGIRYQRAGLKDSVRKAEKDNKKESKTDSEESHT